MSAISLRNVVKSWGQGRAVDGVSFEAAAGTFVVGPAELSLAVVDDAKSSAESASGEM